MKKLLIATLLSFGALTATHAFNVTPQIINLEQRKSIILYLDTTGYKEENTYNFEVNKWLQDGLEPTTDIVVFPRTLKAEPNKRYAVRILYKGDFENIQKTYRLKISRKDTNTSNQDVQVKFGYSLPIFIGPNQPKTMNVSKRVENGKTIFTNNGNSTFRTPFIIQNNEKKKSLIYILPGQSIILDGENIELGERV